VVLGILPGVAEELIDTSPKGSSIFSQLRVVMLYGSSELSSTSLKPTNGCPECQRCWQDRRTLHNRLYPHRGQADQPLAANWGSNLLQPLPQLVPFRRA
jgi:hypothetical protein